MSLLDGDISALFGAAFGSLYLDGTIHAGTGDPVYAADGTITGYTGTDSDCKVQVDSATDAMRRADGFSEGDCRLIVLAQDVAALTSDHSITVRGTRYRLMSVELDAAASHWVCRGRSV